MLPAPPSLPPSLSLFVPIWSDGRCSLRLGSGTICLLFRLAAREGRKEGRGACEETQSGRETNAMQKRSAVLCSTRYLRLPAAAEDLAINCPLPHLLLRSSFAKAPDWQKKVSSPLAAPSVSISLSLSLSLPPFLSVGLSF